MLIFSAIASIASLVSPTARPLSSASRAPWMAMSRISWLLAAFWVMEAVICSRLAVACSTEALWLLVPRERLCAVDDTCVEAVESVATPERTSPIIWARLRVILRSASASVSSFDFGLIVEVRSPAAMESAMPVISWRYATMSRNERPRVSLSERGATVALTSPREMRSAAPAIS